MKSKASTPAPGRPVRGSRTGRPIMAALRARDPNAARAAMRSHLRSVVDDLLEATELEALERARSEMDARRARVTDRLRFGVAN